MACLFRNSVANAQSPEDRPHRKAVERLFLTGWYLDITLFLHATFELSGANAPKHKRDGFHVVASDLIATRAVVSQSREPLQLIVRANRFWHSYSHSETRLV
jgi:hypothetical protein